MSLTVSHIDVHTGPSNGFPSQPLLDTSTRLNCSVTLHPQLSQLTILTIQYQWSSNGVTRGSEQELVLLNLSPSNATTYSCTVTVSSANPGEHLIRQISNQSMYDLRAKGVSHRQCDRLNFFTVPAPNFHLSPGGRGVYYSGEDLNVTCISSVVGAVFAWRAVNFLTQQPLIIPNTTVSSGSNTSVLILRPIRVSDPVLMDFICAVAFPENANIIANTFLILASINGKIIMFLIVPCIVNIFPVSSLSVSVSSNASTVLDISGYNSFTVQCGGTFSPSSHQSGESLSFSLTRNSVPVTDGLSTSPVMATGNTVSQNSSVQQTASSGPATLVYNCTVDFSISGSLITTASNTTQVIVKGELALYTIGPYASLLSTYLEQVPHYQQLQ